MRQSKQNVSAKSNEQRNAYVIEHITNTFLELLAEMPVENISISDLTTKAEIGRASFYRNYTSKEDILCMYIKTLFAEWTKEQNKHPNASLSEQVRTMIAHFEKHRDFYELLNKRGLTYMLKDSIIGIYGPKPEHDMVQAYASSFATYTLYGWIDTWFRRGMKETSDELYEMFKAQGL